MPINPNVDPAEIAKFDALAHSWWDLQGACKPLHQINPARLQFIQQHLPLAGKKILDVGCGGGILAESMARLGAQVTGIDLSESALSVAKQHALRQNLNIDYQLLDAALLAAQAPATFDGITCMELLEHVPQSAKLIAACAQLLKNDAKIFFSTINRQVKAYLMAVLGAEYILKLLPKGTHDYARFIRPSELAQWARQAGLTPQTFAGISYQPFSAQYKLSTNVAVNYLLCCNKAPHSEQA